MLERFSGEFKWYLVIESADKAKNNLISLISAEAVKRKLWLLSNTIKRKTKMWPNEG